MSHALSHQCHNHLNSNSPIEPYGEEKKIHCRLLPWKFFYQPLAMPQKTLSFKFQRPDFARTREKPHGTFIAVLQFPSIGNQEQKSGLENKVFNFFCL